jgi:hypothetical protein
MAFLHTLTIPMGVFIFFALTGVLTWLVFAIMGAWHTLTALEKLVEHITRETEPLRIYREHR